MTATSFADMQDTEFNELLRLARAYHREARRCGTAKAHLAGCALLGASLEASLMATVHCFADDVAISPAAPKAKGRVKPLFSWNLGELLRVAKGLRWLPAQLEPDGGWNQRRARIGDYAEVVRQLRNLLHPARYLADHSHKRVTKRHFALSFEILAAVADHIYERLIRSMSAEMKDERRV